MHCRSCKVVFLVYVGIHLILCMASIENNGYRTSLMYSDYINHDTTVVVLGDLCGTRILQAGYYGFHHTDWPYIFLRISQKVSVRPMI